MAKTVIVTGAAGLIGSEAVRTFSGEGFRVVGIDNDMRRYFFGDAASTAETAARLRREIPDLQMETYDIRDREAIDRLFSDYSSDIALVIHTAAQPSHDWAAREPITDFTINANGTLICWKRRARIAPKPSSSSPPRTRSTATVPISFRWWNGKRAGRSRRSIRITLAASTSRCRSTERCMRSSARRRWPPTSWCRSTAGTSA